MSYYVHITCWLSSREMEMVELKVWRQVSQCPQPKTELKNVTPLDILNQNVGQFLAVTAFSTMFVASILSQSMIFS